MFNTLKKISRAPHLTNRATVSVTDYQSMYALSTCQNLFSKYVGKKWNSVSRQQSTLSLFFLSRYNLETNKRQPVKINVKVIQYWQFLTKWFNFFWFPMIRWDLITLQFDVTKPKQVNL